MQIKNKWRWSALLAVLLVVGLAGLSMAATTVRLGVWGGAQETNELREIINRINKANEGLFQIELVHHPDDYYKKLQVMIAGGVAPDIFYLDQNWTPSFAEAGYLLPLDELIRGDSSIDLDDYFPESLRTAVYKGKTYGLPWIAQPVVLYYNRDIFNAMGVAEPNNTWRWDDFLSAARTFTRDTSGDGEADTWGYIQRRGWPPYEMWIWQNGGDIWSEDGRTSLVDSPEAIEALRFLGDLMNTHGVSPSLAITDEIGSTSRLFKLGRSGMFMGGAADGFYDVSFDVGVSVVPHQKRRATFSWIANLHISSSAQTAEKIDVVWKAYTQLLEGIHMWKVVPPRRSLARHLLDIEPRMPSERVQPIFESMEYARGITPIVEQARMDSILTNSLWNPLLLGTQPVEQIARELKRQFEMLVK